MVVLCDCHNQDQGSLFSREYVFGSTFSQSNIFQEVLPQRRERIVEVHISSTNLGRHQGFVVFRTSNDFQLKVLVEVTIVKGEQRAVYFDF